MVRRPLKDRRIFGPFVGDYSDSENEDSSGLDKEESELLKQALNWHNNISDEKLKRKYIVNYIDGITNEDFSTEEIEDIVDRADL